MTVADQISAARALIEPLTGYSSGPWTVVTDLPAIAIAAGKHRVVQTPNQNNYRHFGPSERWLGIESFNNADLIAAAPALRDTVAALADLADAQAQEIARLKATIRALDLVLERSGYAPSSLAREAIRAALADAQGQRVEEWRQDYRALEGAHRVMREANARLIAERDAQAQENARLRYVLEGVRGAIDTGRNEPLMIWRDQINIALGDAP